MIFTVRFTYCQIWNIQCNIQYRKRKKLRLNSITCWYELFLSVKDVFFISQLVIFFVANALFKKGLPMRPKLGIIIFQHYI